MVCTLFILLFVFGVFGGDAVPEKWNVDRKLKKVLESRELVYTSNAINGFQSDAVVWISCLGRHQSSVTVATPRVAFAIGDGNLLITAAHCVDSFDNIEDKGEKKENHAISRDLVVISPYYGDVFGFEIVAVDKEADLAILKADWDGHPALELASEKELDAAKTILTAGFPPQFIANSRDEKIDKDEIGDGLRFSRKVWSEELPFKILTDKGANHNIALIGTRYIGPGWSGSAMVLPESGKVVGVICNLNPIRKSKSFRIFGLPVYSRKNIMYGRNSAGCGISSIRDLVEKHNLQTAAYKLPGKYEAIDNSKEAFSTVIKYFEEYLQYDLDMTLNTAKKLVFLRGESSRAHLLLACIAQNCFGRDSTKEELRSLSEESYKESIRLNDDNGVVHTAYGNFLNLQKRYDEALIETEKALAIDPNDQLSLVNRMGLLQKSNPEEAEKLAVKLTTTFPEVAHFWFSYSTILRGAKKYEESLKAVETAIRLRPEGLYGGELAIVYDSMERYDEAEKYYKKMTVDCKCQNCLWRYSRFLVMHRPEKLEEAEKALDAAVAIKTRRISKLSLNYTRLEILEKKSPDEAEVFCRDLLEKHPDNKNYWFAMAGILRTVKKNEEALEAIRKAVEICPDCTFDARLADILGKTGRLEEAESVYDGMLSEHPERPKYWFWYAGFLNEYYPDRKDESREALSKASVEDVEWDVAKKDLEELRAKVSDESTDAI